MKNLKVDDIVLLIAEWDNNRGSIGTIVEIKINPKNEKGSLYKVRFNFGEDYYCSDELELYNRDPDQQYIDLEE